MAANLFSDLAQPGWHSSIMTTYSVDPAFYDGSIEYRLRLNGCENNILMADATMLKRALQATPEAFRKAGTRYVVVPVPSSGCFHPKIHLRLGTQGARLLIGSANATAAGWGVNQEIVSAIDFKVKGEGDTLAVGPLIRRVYDYLLIWLADVPGDALSHKLDLHKRDARWLFELEDNAAPIVLADGTAIDVFCERGLDRRPRDEAGMLSRLIGLADGETASRLIVISPYWDTGLEGLRDLQAAFPQASTLVGVNPERSEFPISALGRGPPVHFADIRNAHSADRFLHAKLFVVETNLADHVLFGSANCSDDALGRRSAPAMNAETSIYRRLPPSSFAAQFGLDLSRSVDQSNLREPEVERSPFTSRGQAFPGGVVELEDGAFTWYPAPSATPAATKGARILYGKEMLALRPVGNGRLKADVDEIRGAPVVVRIAFENGCISDPVIVHDDKALRLSAPGQTDRRLRMALDRVARGEDDFIALAHQAHLLFASDGGTQRNNGGRSGRKRSDEVDEQAYAKALALRDSGQEPANGKSGRFWVDEPGLLELLKIVCGGDRRLVESGEGTDEDDIDDGENQEGDQDPDLLETDKPLDARGNSAAGAAGHECDSELNKKAGSTNGKRVYSVAEVARDRAALKRALESFEKLLADCAKTEEVSNRLPTQAVFVLYLMMVTTTRTLQMGDGARVRLMTLTPDHGADRDLVFSVRAGRILQRLWIGEAAIAAHISVDQTRRLPDDLFQFVVMSRWSIEKACRATADFKPLDTLNGILRKTAAQLLTSSTSFGSIDKTAERERMHALDVAFGFIEPP